MPSSPDAIAPRSPVGTTVSLEVEVAQSDARIVITDEGAGISPEQREHIGRRFYRAPGTQASGSGLGLSIVQRILDLHGGTMHIDTPATGNGLQVTVVLPRVREGR